MEKKPTNLIDFGEMSRDEQSLDMLIGGVTGIRQNDFHGLEHSMSIRLDAFNYPRVKALSILSGSSMNSIINNMLEVAYATMLERMNEEDREFLKLSVLGTSHDWLSKQTEKK